MNFDVAGGVGVVNYRWDHRTKAFWSVLCYINSTSCAIGSTNAVELVGHMDGIDWFMGL